MSKVEEDERMQDWLRMRNGRVKVNEGNETSCRFKTRKIKHGGTG